MFTKVSSAAEAPECNLAHSVEEKEPATNPASLRIDVG